MDYLTDKPATEHIRKKGIPVGDNFLGKAASSGTGPIFRYSGRYRIYTVEDLDAWIEARLSAPVRKTNTLLRGASAQMRIDPGNLSPPTTKACHRKSDLSTTADEHVEA
jgi:hypothetical protein